jgi:hypothetical protein
MPKLQGTILLVFWEALVSQEERCWLSMSKVFGVALVMKDPTLHY